MFQLWALLFKYHKFESLCQKITFFRETWNANFISSEQWKDQSISHERWFWPPIPPSVPIHVYFWSSWKTAISRASNKARLPWRTLDIISGNQMALVLAELWRAKCASKAPWVKENGNSSNWENLVMTSAYGQTSERPSVRTNTWGGGGAYSK